eukprot:scaffold2917_cov191-Amphora_coffeaeformis.AAC.48
MPLEALYTVSGVDIRCNQSAPGNATVYSLDHIPHCETGMICSSEHCFKLSFFISKLTIGWQMKNVRIPERGRFSSGRCDIASFGGGNKSCTKDKEQGNRQTLSEVILVIQGRRSSHGSLLGLSWRKVLCVWPLNISVTLVVLRNRVQGDTMQCCRCSWLTPNNKMKDPNLFAILPPTGSFYYYLCRSSRRSSRLCRPAQTMLRIGGDRLPRTANAAALPAAKKERRRTAGEKEGAARALERGACFKYFIFRYVLPWRPSDR